MPPAREGRGGRLAWLVLVGRAAPPVTDPLCRPVFQGERIRRRRIGPCRYLVMLDTSGMVASY